MGFRLSKYRRVIQGIFFVAFFLLLVISAKQIVLPFPVQLFLVSDPLIALVAIIAGLPLITALLYSLVTIIATFLFGRVFCGYACPMGTFLDLFSPLSRLFKADKKSFRKLKVLPVAMLAAVLVLSFFKIGVVMILDPISLFTRATTVIAFPVIDLALSKIVDGMYRTFSLAPTANTIVANLDGILVFPYQRVFNAGQWIILFFVFIVSLNMLGKRFWCRYLCPLGGLLGLIGRIPLFRRKVDATACTGCLKCEKNCDMDAVANNGLATDAASCVFCLKCRNKCSKDAVSWGLKPELTTEIPSRRTAITAVAGSIAIATLVPFKSEAKGQSPTLIRPPGVSNEEAFLRKCIRCGQCLKACPSNVLQPALLQYGVDALWTPHLDFKMGVCDWECNACGRVCPTGAIQHLALEKKQAFVIGIAEIDRSRCYPWVAGHGCRVCAHMCPIPGKAIEMRDTGKYDASGMGIVLPHVKKDNCTGCGICEVACPVRGQKAIRIFRTGVKNPFPHNAEITPEIAIERAQKGSGKLPPVPLY